MASNLRLKTPDLRLRTFGLKNAQLNYINVWLGFFMLFQRLFETYF
jgi:hypothetical protein